MLHDEPAQIADKMCGLDVYGRASMNTVYESKFSDLEPPHPKPFCPGRQETPPTQRVVSGRGLLPGQKDNG